MIRNDSKKGWLNPRLKLNHGVNVENTLCVFINRLAVCFRCWPGIYNNLYTNLYNNLYKNLLLRFPALCIKS